MSKQHLPKLDICQNCETPTPGNYCPECGQDSREHRVALRLLVVGLWNDLFTFDNRFWHSFLILLTRPGELTLRYMGGKRVRYIPPARMYLFVSIVFFFILGAVAENDDSFVTMNESEEDAEVAAAVVDSLRTELADVPGVPPEALATLNMTNLDATEDDGDDGTIDGTMFGEEFELTREDLVHTVFNLAPKGMFLLLPIFAALLALVYRRSRRVYVEHLIFSLHFHTLVFILMLVAVLAPWDWVSLVMWIGFHVYLYLAMKHVYRQGWLKTWLKHFLLVSSYNVVLMGFLVAVLGGSIWLVSKAPANAWWVRWIG